MMHQLLNRVLHNITSEESVHIITVHEGHYGKKCLIFIVSDWRDGERERYGEGMGGSTELCPQKVHPVC